MTTRSIKQDETIYVGWLEIFLFLAAISLLFQLFPGVGSGIATAALWLFGAVFAVVDIRNWSWGVWVGVEIGVIVFLLVLRAWKNREVD